MTPLTINNYEFDAPLSSEKSGFSQWGIGLKGGRYFFVKQFLSPIYPVDASMFYPEEIQNKMQECENFVDEKKKLYSAIRRASDGNLVSVEQFFREDAKYYISTESISGHIMSIEEISQEPFENRVRLCCSIAHSFSNLHREHIVHADVKPDNFLVYERNVPQAKVIDFDCSFFEDNAPKLGEELNCDLTYLTPEGYLHLIEQESNLTCKLDVFALGLVFHQFLTGKMPEYDHEEYQYAYESVLDDHPLKVQDSMASEIRKILEQMLQKAPESRPTMENVFKELHDLLLKLLERKEIVKDPVKRDPELNSKVSVMSPYFTPAGDL